MQHGSPVIEMKSAQNYMKFKAKCAKCHKGRTGKSKRNLKGKRDWTGKTYNWRLRWDIMGRWLKMSWFHNQKHGLYVDHSNSWDGCSNKGLYLSLINIKEATPFPALHPGVAVTIVKGRFAVTVWRPFLLCEMFNRRQTRSLANHTPSTMAFKCCYSIPNATSSSWSAPREIDGALQANDPEFSLRSLSEICPVEVANISTFL